MADPLRPDLCVIGAGSAGLSVAAAAAQFGVPVVQIERGRMGGDCLNYGCVPSKALLAAAKRAQAMRSAGTFGIEPVEPDVSFARLHDRIHQVITDIAPNDSVERFTALGVQVIKGEAKFLDKRRVQVGDTIVRPRRFVIATGSSPRVPDIAGLAGVPYLTNETIFDLTERIGHLIVLGAGAVGIELGQAYARLGARVTLIDQATPLAGYDPEAARLVLQRVQDEGVTIESGVAIDRVEKTESGIKLHGRREGNSAAIEGSHLLVATGRVPNLEALDLKAARVKQGDDGIKVDAHMRTSNSRIYAIGDCVGPPYFTHLGAYHAELVIRNALFRLKPSLDLGRLPRALYTDPEVAEIGVGEAEARKRSRDIKVLRWPFAENDRAVIEAETAGFVKLVTDKEGTILGVTIVGANAGELIALFALALEKSLKVGALVRLILPYPTLAEAAKRAALLYYQPLVRKPFLRRIIALLRRLG